MVGVARGMIGQRRGGEGVRGKGRIGYYRFGRKTSPRTSTIVQFIFYFWSFEISVNILRNQK